MSEEQNIKENINVCQVGLSVYVFVFLLPYEYNQ